ncbi:class I SAM-dependent methyltransferase [Geodermatophilus sp. URMC 64]
MSTDLAEEQHGHLPPMGREWLLPLYDPFTRLLGVRRLHEHLAETAAVRPGHRVLEIGCGTGNLALLVKARCPEATVTGIDPDLPALAIATRKSRRRRLPVRWDVGSAAELPYADGSVDRVLSSLMLHHVPDGQKARAIAEVHRVLRPGGELHLLDFGGPRRSHASVLLRRAQADTRLRGQWEEGIADLLRGAGLTEVAVTGRFTKLGSPITAYRAVNPGA